MSYYTDRWVKFKKETAWGTWNAPDTIVNYLMDWSATTTENKEEENIIAGARDFKKRVWLEEGVVGKWTQELVTGKMFEFILGTYTTAAPTTGPFTYSVISTIPSMSIFRGVYPDETNSTFAVGYYGMKVDSADLTIESKGPVNLEISFAGRGSTIPIPPLTGLGRSTPDMTQVAYAFHNSSISLISPGPNTTWLDNVSKFVMTMNNNLEARYSAGANSYRAVELREGALEISGRITLGGDLTTMSSIVTSRQDCTLILNLIKNGGTIVATLKNVSFDEMPDELKGLDVVELEFPFVARPSSGSDALVVVETSGTAFTSMAY
jgi:hypothetical protein